VSELHHKIALIVKNNQTGNCIRDLSDASGGKTQTPSAANSAVQRDHSVCVLFNLFQTNSVSEKFATLTARYGAPFRVNEITPRYWVSHAPRVAPVAERRAPIILLQDENTDEFALLSRGSLDAKWGPIYRSSLERNLFTFDI